MEECMLDHLHKSTRFQKNIYIYIKKIPTLYSSDLKICNSLKISFMFVNYFIFMNSIVIGTVFSLTKTYTPNSN